MRGKNWIVRVFILNFMNFRKEIQLLKFQTDAESLIFTVNQNFSK